MAWAMGSSGTMTYRLKVQCLGYRVWRFANLQGLFWDFYNADFLNIPPFLETHRSGLRSEG